jgi:hypothetical protein
MHLNARWSGFFSFVFSSEHDQVCPKIPRNSLFIHIIDLSEVGPSYEVCGCRSRAGQLTQLRRSKWAINQLVKLLMIDTLQQVLILKNQLFYDSLMFQLPVK